MKDRILSLLGSGLQPSLVASAVGCSPSYITQLLSEESFVGEVSALRVKDIEQIKARDGKWDSLEDILLQRLQDLIPFMLRPREVIHALSIVNGARRRSEDLKTAPSQQHITNNTVVLVLPQKTVSQFELSKNNEIISIEGRSITPLSSAALLREVGLQPLGDSKNAPSTLKQNERLAERQEDQRISDKDFSERGEGRILSGEEIERTIFHSSV